jgi:hypothetical protein
LSIALIGMSVLESLKALLSCGILQGDEVSPFICKTDRSQNMVPDEKRGYLNQYPGEEIAKRLEEIIKSVDKDLELDLDFDQGYTVS